MSILLVLPFFGALLYGLSYAIMGVALKTVSLSTYMFYNFFFSTVFMGLLIWIDRDNLNVRHVASDPKTIALLVIAICAGWGGYVITTLVIKHVNPTYAAIGEIAYPAFVPLFAWWLFRDKQWDISTLAGGLLVFTGLFIIVFGKKKLEVAS